ncbi:hypothetical protein CAEBREN_07200 [Caenorhabditis brenneri]|uniref:DUF38 domain-containing protein n=1 Tax=Caenorhabditis brenneri TaxID=135651 RepID=G0MTF2_CAEBE|nr:hypothetical protein CAEBREN_07200 [Caenorhabditis brenneri]
MKLRISAICYAADENELKVSIRNILKDDESIGFLKINPLIGDKKLTSKLNIGGTKFDCRWYNYIIESFGVEASEIQLAFSNHISSLFQPCSDIELKLSPAILASKRFPNIENVTDTSISAKRHVVEASTIKEVIERYPNQKGIAIMGDVNGLLEESSSIFHTENIYFHGALDNGPMLVEKFTGRVAIMNKVFVDGLLAIPNILEAWISGEKYQNLEVLLVYASDICFIYDRIQEDFLNRGIAKHWSPSERPKIFPLFPRIIGYDKKRVRPEDCSAYLDIQRKTDGKRASFAADLFAFHFLVWN